MAGFDPHAYLSEPDDAQAAGAFDPHAYLSEKDSMPDVADVSGAGQAATEHFGNAATMGYLPQLQAMTERGAKYLGLDPSGGVDAKLKAQGFHLPDDPSYVELRDENIKRLAQQEEAHPVASAAGTVGGVVASGAGMGALSGGARAASVGGRILQGAKAGATMAAIANPGDTEGEIDPLQAGARLQNAKIGAVTGGAVQGALEAAPLLGKAAGAAGRKLGAVLSGVNQDEIDNYAARTNQINNMIEQSGGELPAAADKVRQETQDAIRAKRGELSGQIGAALKKAPSDPVHDIQPIKDQLSKVMNRLDPDLNSDARQSIQDTIDKIDAVAGRSDNGKVSVQDLHKITGFLQDQGKSAYLKGGQIFQNPAQAAQAAKGAAAVSRKMLNEAAPEVATANNQLSMLHSIEGSLNKNLIAPGKPDSALFAAGSGSNPRNAKMLERLGSLTGTDTLQKAKDLATMRTFANPALLPMDATGKSATRMLLAAGAGHMLAGPAGMAFGAAASPAAVKLGINAANAISPAVGAIGRFAQNNATALQRAAQSATTPARNESSPDIPIDAQTLGMFRANPSLIESVTNKQMKAAILKQLNRAPANKAAQHFAEGGEVKSLGQIIGYPGSGAPKPKQPKEQDDSSSSGNSLGHAIGYPGYSKGGSVPGTPKVAGNSLKNDTVSAKLSPGEIVLPRSVTMAKNAPQAAAKFVAAHQSKAKGEAKWAAQGLAKLGIQDQALAARLTAHPKARSLLIQASDLPHGSKALNKIMDQIRKVGA